MNNLEKYVRSNEGENLKPYFIDNKLHIGIGHNLDDCGISRTVSEFIFKSDLEDAENSLKRIFSGEWSLFPDKIQMVLIDVVFNMGTRSFLEFEKTIRFLKKHDYKNASEELLRSVYASKLPGRASRNSEIIKEAAVIDKNDDLCKLKADFDSVIAKYIACFSQKHNESLVHWDSKINGGVAYFQTYFARFEDIRFDIDNGLSKTVFEEWVSLLNYSKSLSDFIREDYGK